MIDTLKKWLFRKWNKWEVFREDYKLDINRNKDHRIITTMRQVSNDGLIRYKTVKNF